MNNMIAYDLIYKQTHNLCLECITKAGKQNAGEVIILEDWTGQNPLCVL